MPTLRSHTHLQATQIQAQSKACKRVCLPKHTTDRNNAAKMKDRFTKVKNGQLVTKCMCHKGFSWYSSVVARSNFRVGGQETTPQSLTAHTLKRYKQPYGRNKRQTLIKQI